MRHDPAALAEDQHHPLPWCAKQLGISESAARSFFKKDSRIRYHPITPGGGRKRRTMLVPDTVFREAYVNHFRL